MHPLYLWVCAVGVAPADRYHSTFHLREDITVILLTDLAEIHVIELPKLRPDRKESAPRRPKVALEVENIFQVNR
ncbi:MAG TPA: hypothetical protein GX517_00405 [Alicyclobacillus sp.]|nr:hypothetical protein [Alicyclobacillus sp.]